MFRHGFGYGRVCAAFFGRWGVAVSCEREGARAVWMFVEGGFVVEECLYETG
jgi:hypothetical protein